MSWDNWINFHVILSKSLYRDPPFETATYDLDVCGLSYVHMHCVVTESEGDGEVAPQFLSRPESNIYSFGDLILLECDVIGSPTPSISWYRDGTKLAPGTRTKSLYDGRVALLKISQSATEDSGKYEVVAQNSCGKVAVDCLVVVKGE